MAGLQYSTLAASKAPTYGPQGQVVDPAAPPTATPPTTPGLSFDAGKAAEAANPPAYGPQGQVIDPSAALAGMKAELNNFQNATFDQASTPAPTRQSSALGQTITDAQTQEDADMKAYRDLVTKYETLQPTSLYDQFTQLNKDQGVPALQDSVASLDAQRNNLPYVNQANSGNAGLETQGQLNADTAQKDIPLAVQQQNALTRLQLAQSFVNTAINLKDKDSTAAADALSKALDLASNTVQMSTNHVTALQNQQKDADAKQVADQQHAQDTLNSILTLTKGSTWDDLDSQTQAVITTAAANSSLTLDAVKKAMTSSANGDDKALVQDLASKYPDAGILLTDTYAQASSKLSKSRIYQEQVRPPVSTSTIPTGTTSIVDATTDAGVKAIIAANPGEWGHAADAIDTKYGPGTATKYDSWLKAVYQNGQSVNNLVSGGSTGNPVVDSWVSLVATGQAAVTAVPTANGLRNAVITALNQSGQSVTLPQQTTDAERTAAGYADRLVNSNQVIDQYQQAVASYNPAGYAIQQNLPNFLKSSTVQQVEQAQSDFVNAVLRRESGAAISQSEYDNAKKQYFPQPGDSAATIAQKAKNRATQITNLQRDAGPVMKGSSNAGNLDLSKFDH